MSLKGSRRFVSAALLVLAIALGGGYAPERALLLELLALLLLCLVLGEGGVPGGRRAVPALSLLAIILALPLLQLVPLPATLWQSLPGRSTVTAIARATGMGGSARPLSLSPDLTWEAWGALLAPTALFVATLSSGKRDRSIFLWIVLSGSLASAVVGLLQAQAGIALHLYEHQAAGYPTGLFANHNQQADFLLIGMICGLALLIDRRTSDFGTVILVASVVALAVGVVVSGSRTGMALLFIPLLFGARQLLSRRGLVVGCVGGMLLVAAGYVVLSQSSVALRSVGRFDDLSDARPVFWRTTLEGAKAMLPFGSGFGTFMPVYQMFERPNDIEPYVVNDAHNDYLELLLEGGLPAMALLLAYGTLLATRLGRARETESAAAFAVIAVVLVHSLVDYPLRMPSLAVVFALFNGMLFAPRRSEV